VWRWILFSLVDIGDQLVRNHPHVFLPVLAVLALAASVITLDTVQQQNGHVDDVEVGQQVLGTAGHAHGQRQQQIADIVEVARQTPVAGAEQQRLVRLAIRCHERSANDLGRLAPNHALAIGGANNVLLVVDRAEDEVSCRADGEDDAELDWSQVDRVAEKVVGLECVLCCEKKKRPQSCEQLGEGKKAHEMVTQQRQKGPSTYQPWQPDGITPSEVKAEMIVGNINGTEVPVLVVEKVQDVGGMEQVQQDHRVGHVADLLVLGSCERQVDHGPGDDSRATVVEQLEVKVLADTGVELDTHQEIVDERARELAVGSVGWEVVCLEVAEESQEVSVQVGRDQETSPVVLDDGQFPPAKVQATSSVNDVRDGPGEQSIDLRVWREKKVATLSVPLFCLCIALVKTLFFFSDDSTYLVGKKVSGGSSLAISNLSGQKRVQCSLEEQPRQVDADGIKRECWQFTKEERLESFEMVGCIVDLQGRARHRTFVTGAGDECVQDPEWREDQDTERNQNGAERHIY